MDPSPPARTERSALIARLLRVRSIVYVLAGVPVILSPYGTPDTRILAFVAIVLAGVTPLVARRVEQASSVRVAAMSDLIISFGIWLFVPGGAGLSMLVAMLAVAFSVFLDTPSAARVLGWGAVGLQALKAVALVEPSGLLVGFPAVDDAPSTYVMVASTVGMLGAYISFVAINQYIGGLRYAPETSEQRYRSLMDTAPVAFVVVLDDIVVYANQAAGQLFDCEPDDIVGTAFSERVTADSLPAFKKLRRTVLRKFGAIDRETIALHTLTGADRIVELSANPVDHGDRLALQLMLHDRTAQRVAEEKLHKTTVDYQMFFERIPVALYRSKPDGRIVDVNQAAVELLGAKDRSEIVGTNAADYYVDSANRDQLAGMLSDAGVVAGYEWQMIRRDGAKRWIRDTSRFIETSDGRFFEGAMVDVTTRRDIEDELWSRAVQQEAAASIGQLALETEDVQAVCETLSQIVGEVLGASAVAVMRRDSEGRFKVVGKSADLGFDPSMLSGVADRAHMSAAPVVLRTEAEVRFAAPALLDHGFRSCIALMIPGKEIEFGTLVLLSETERVYSSEDVNFLYSITNVLAAAVDRASAYERLEALVQSKDAFVASVSHELRTPLTVVSGLADELSQRWRTLSEAEMEEFMSMLVGQSLDMADLIEDLLVAARANIGNVTVRVVPVDVSKEVDNVMAGFERQTDKSIRSDIQAATIEADPTRFRQILRNLMSNAIRYGGQNIEVVGSSRSGVYAIEVRDDGAPISMADRERIFEPYERAHDTSGRPGSVGLGLAVSRTLAELMRGSLTYHHDGQSVFRLELPGDDDLDDAPYAGVRGDEALRALGTVGTSRIGVDIGSVQ